MYYASASASTSAAISKEIPKKDQPNVSILDLDVPESEQEALPDVDDEIKKRLQVIKQPLVPEEVQSVSDIGKRLANLKGIPFREHNNIDALNKVDKRTEQEKTNDIMKQFLEENEIDSNAAGAAMNDFDADEDPIKSIERRLAALKGTPTTSDNNKSHSNDENEDEETATNKIVKQVRSHSLFKSRFRNKKIEIQNYSQYLEAAKLPNSELTPEEKEYVESIKPTEDTEELPWCTICNEDATIRCEGCDDDLFCRACFQEIHADDEEYREHRTKKFVAKEENIGNV